MATVRRLLDAHVDINSTDEVCIYMCFMCAGRIYICLHFHEYSSYDGHIHSTCGIHLALLAGSPIYMHSCFIMRGELFACEKEHLWPFLVHAVSRTGVAVSVVCMSAILKPKTILDDCSNLKARHIMHHIVAVLQPYSNLPLGFVLA